MAGHLLLELPAGQQGPYFAAMGVPSGCRLRKFSRSCDRLWQKAFVLAHFEGHALCPVHHGDTVCARSAGNLAFPLLLVGGLFLLSRRQGGGMGGPGGNNPLNFGKSKAKFQMEPNTGITFDDVAGVDEAKADFMEVGWGLCQERGEAMCRAAHCHASGCPFFELPARP